MGRSSPSTVLRRVRHSDVHAADPHKRHDYAGNLHYFLQHAGKSESWRRAPQWSMLARVVPKPGPRGGLSNTNEISSRPRLGDFPRHFGRRHEMPPSQQIPWSLLSQRLLDRSHGQGKPRGGNTLALLLQLRWQEATVSDTRV